MDELTDGALTDPVAEPPAADLLPPPADLIPPPPAGARRRRGWWRAFPPAAVVAAAIGVLAVGSSGDAEPKSPAQWDGRVDELVSYVEYHRGLDFEHPVEINFLAEKEFVEQVTSDKADLTDDEQAELEDFEALFRAVGLAREDFDLFDANNDLQGGFMLAYYDPDTEEVTVRGTEMTVGVKVTLVHELTHALQDQHFDLGLTGSFATDAQNSAYDAIVEGDAQRIGNGYLAELSEEDYNAYFDELYPVEEETASDAAAEEPADVPAWMSALNEAPYVLGEPFTGAVLAVDGQAALDKLFTKPPATEEQLLDPARFLEEDKAKKVAAPKLAKGDRIIDEGDFGTISLLVMLAERIPVDDAIAAVDGWGGDSYAAFERDGKVCTIGRFVGDDASQTDELGKALRAFGQAMPKGSVTVTRKGATVELLACDPGAKAKDGNGASYDALSKVVGRSQTFSYLVADGTPTAQAACLAAGVNTEFTPEELAAPDDVENFEVRMEAIRGRCD